MSDYYKHIQRLKSTLIQNLERKDLLSKAEIRALNRGIDEEDLYEAVSDLPSIYLVDSGEGHELGLFSYDPHVKCFKAIEKTMVNRVLDIDVHHEAITIEVIAQFLDFQWSISDAKTRLKKTYGLTI
jgi:hypothetical protein